MFTLRARWCTFEGYVASLTAAMTLVFGVIAGAPAEAQRTKFDPRLALSYFYRSRVNYFGEQARDDSSLRMTLALPVIREYQKGSLRFIYQGHLEKFEEFDQLDDLGHRLGLDLNWRPSQRSSLNLGGQYWIRRDQLDPTSTDTVDLLAFRQLQREQGAIDLGYSWQIGKRWSANVGARAGAYKFNEVVDQPPEVEPDTEDRSEILGAIGASRRFSDKSGLGFSFGARRFDLDQSGRQDVVSASLVYSREVLDKSSLSLQIGGFSMQTGQFIDDEQQTRSGVQGSLSINRQFRRLVGILSASHAPNVGGARIGSAVVSHVRIGLADSHFRNWGWALGTTMGYRDPNDPEVVVVQTLTTTAAINVKAHRFLGLNFHLTWADQIKGEDEAGTDFLRVGASLSWQPFGWTKIASEGI